MTHPGRGPTDDDFRAADLAGPPHPIAADFVDRTLAAIRTDQLRIRAEAARVDEAEIPARLLAAFAAPAPAVDFVDRTLAAMRLARAAGDVHELLASYEAPPASPDFVARTLDALRDTSPAPRGPRALPPASRLPRLLPWVAAAAAAVATILLLVGGRDPAPRREVFTVQDFSPAVLSTGFDRATAGAAAGLRFAPADPLLQLASDRRRSGE